MDKESIQQLKELEQKQNSGRGIGCVKTIIMFLENDNVSEALSTYASEYDKIRSYPDVDEFLEQHIFGEELTKSKVCKVKWFKI